MMSFHEFAEKSSSLWQIIGVAFGVSLVFAGVLLTRKKKPQTELDRLVNTRGTTGGLIKRIEENREIMALIYAKAPQLVSENPWLVGWLNANDEFFTQLAAIAPPREKTRSSMYPNRPEPIKA